MKGHTSKRSGTVAKASGKTPSRTHPLLQACPSAPTQDVAPLPHRGRDMHPHILLSYKGPGSAPSLCQCKMEMSANHPCVTASELMTRSHYSGKRPHWVNPQSALCSCESGHVGQYQYRQDTSEPARDCSCTDTIHLLDFESANLCLRFRENIQQINTVRKSGLLPGAQEAPPHT